MFSKNNNLIIAGLNFGSVNPTTTTTTTTTLAPNYFSQLGNNIVGESNDDQFGYCVSLSSSGTILAIGAPFNDGNGTWSGSVRVYSWNGSSWIQRGGDIDGEAAGDYSGVSVSLSDDGDFLAIGSPYNDGNGTDSGSVRVYKWI